MNGIAGLSPRFHMFVQPKFRGDFAALFRDVLGCKVIERDVGLPYPLLLVPFPNGSSFSVEFTELALDPQPDESVDDDSAFRGAWIEFRTDDVASCQQKLRAAGIKEFRHSGSPHVYFVAPGGQVFRLVDITYEGP